MKEVRLWEKEIGDEGVTQWRDYLRVLAGVMPESHYWEKYGDHDYDEPERMTLWIDGWAVKVWAVDYWELTSKEFFLSSPANKNDFARLSRGSVGILILALLKKLGLETEREILDWAMGLIGQGEIDAPIIEVSIPGWKREEERLAVGPKGELALWTPEGWMTRTGELVSERVQGGWATIRM